MTALPDNDETCTCLCTPCAEFAGCAACPDCASGCTACGYKADVIDRLRNVTVATLGAAMDRHAMDAPDDVVELWKRRPRATGFAARHMIVDDPGPDDRRAA